MGRTVRLQEDLEAILSQLGYSGASARVNFSSFHCGVTCPQAPGQAHIPTIGSQSLRTVGSFSDVVRERLSAVRRTRWYDERTARKVASLFAIDFAAFNFSTDASEMFEAPSSMAMPADSERLFAELRRTSSLARARPEAGAGLATRP